MNREQKAPLLRLRYWAGIALASVFGADVGDFISHYLHLGHWRGVVPLILLFWGVIKARRRGWIGWETGYWIAVIIVRAGATNLADLVDHDLDVNTYLLSGVLFALFAISALWPVKADATATVSVQGLPDTSGNYWLALFFAGALGTVLGDAMSDQFGLLVSSLALTCGFIGLLLFRNTRALGGKPGYWAMILAARTAGTSVGDLIADKTFLGLAGSTFTIGFMMLLTLWLWPRPTTDSP
jgi:uncharacterized membrane-anchored protein